MIRSSWLPFLLPCFVFLLLAPFTPFLDLRISSAFFHFPSGFNTESSFNQFFYLYGEWPAFAICYASLIIFIVSFFFNSWEPFRKPALMLMLVLAIGTGLITNVLLKDHWGRPRPRQITEFGGKWTYTPFYQPDFGRYSDAKKSFPSGHATMGFYFFALARIGFLRRNRILAFSGMLGTILLGGGLSLCRISMGGHFFSDVLASALIMWMTTIFLERVLFSEGKMDERAYQKTA